jgi:succinyl-diaminopimelate desuccinylase
MPVDSHIGNAGMPLLSQMWRLIMSNDEILKVIEAYFAAHEEEYLADLGRLVSIASERGAASEEYPFGEKPYQALREMLRLADAYGFETRCIDNCIGYVQYPSTRDDSRELDILAHMDVVPAGEGWTKTDPFVLKREGDILYGRGTADDKGPALAALYAMRAIKESGIELEKPVRLILGTDEECGSGDLPHYYDRIDPAPCTFTPDSDYPLINIEKGRFTGIIRGSFEERTEKPRLLRLDSGVKTNVIPAKAVAIIEGDIFDEVSSIAAKVQAVTGVSITVTRSGEEEITVAAEGRQGHAATPQSGNNALTAMLALINTLELAYSDGHKMMTALAHLFPHGDWLGRAAGAAMSDESSGNLTMSLNILHYTPTGIYGEFDSRICVSATRERLDVVRLNLEAAGMTLEANITEPHVVDADSPFIRTLLDCYEKVSGKKGYCMSTGGGTYVHDIKNGVAFGCAVEDFDNNMHGADEKASLQVLMMSGRIFALAITRLCGMKQGG